MDNSDNAKIAKLINKSVHLKFLFCGVFTADSFSKLFADPFIAVNATELLDLIGYLSVKKRQNLFC